MERRKLTKTNSIELAQEAVSYLHKDKAIIFPTDTLYALGVNALSAKGIETFFALKKRPDNKPVPIFVKDIQMAKSIAFVDKQQEAILKKLWPGPFTFVLRAKKIISKQLIAGGDTVGLRIPDNEFCQTLLNSLRVPITASSANVSGMEASSNLNEIIKQFKKYSVLPELIIGAGNLSPSEPSTVIDITNREPKLLRINQSTLPKLKEVFPKLR